MNKAGYEALRGKYDFLCVDSRPQDGYYITSYIDVIYGFCSLHFIGVFHIPQANPWGQGHLIGGQ